ncbi:MAG: endonuclease/exonuclease/phosphatase family protein [Spirochaetales bacterium]|nr:endonuclease/exonuclease/phosphatase family protein [Spirochaetales bacterium]
MRQRKSVYSNLAGMAAVILMVAAIFYPLLAQAQLQSRNQNNISSTPPAELPERLRIATWNVHDCQAVNKKTGQVLLLHSILAQSIARERIDIIALQEVQTKGTRGSDIEPLQQALMAEGWSMSYHAVASTQQGDDLAIFSRYPVEQYGIVSQPADAAWPRAGLHATIRIHDRELVVYNFHFKAFDDPRSLEIRRAQAAALAAHLRTRFKDGIQKAGVVLAGDFNTVSTGDFEGENATLRLLQLRENDDLSDDFESINLRWEPLEPTYRTIRFASITDHLILSPALRSSVHATSVQIVAAPDTGFGFPVSDHRLLIVDINPQVLPQSSR